MSLIGIDKSLFSIPELTLVLLISIGLLFWRSRRPSSTGSEGLDKAPKIAIPNALFGPLWAKFHYIKHGFRMVQEAYEAHPDEIFLAPDQELYVVPAKYLDELKSQPATVLSSTQAVLDYFLGDYTTLDPNLFSPTTWNILRGRLGQQVGDLAPLLDAECIYALEHELPQSSEWNPVTLFPAILRIVARIFVGSPLCLDEEWLHASIDFSRCVFIGIGYLKIFSPFLRPIVAYLVPYIRRIHAHHRTCWRLLAPLVATRRAKMAAAKSSGTEWLDGDERPQDMLQWYLDDPLEGDARLERIAAFQLVASFGAVDGTTNHIVNCLFDLAERWDDYAEELRAEIEEVLKEDRGRVRKTNMNQLSKLDSFMKESQRMNPLGAISFKRKVLIPHTLSDGTFLPRNTIIGMASGPMTKSTRYHSSPEIFDGFRFHKLRLASSSEQGKASNAHQFTTTGPGTLIFGHGKFACPGRFFASLQSKIVLAQILRDYDLRLKPGEGRRPKNLLLGDANIIDWMAGIEFRKRKTAR